MADFDNPHAPADSSFGSSTPLPLEYSVAHGDSGGGTFIAVGGAQRLAGVNSFIQSGPNGDMVAIADYGDLSGFTRVSQFNDWIDDNTAANWNNASGGAAATAANWTNSLLPDTTDTLSFSVGGTYTVNFSGTNSFQKILARRGNVTLDLGGATQTVNSPMSNGSLVVGRDNGDNATLTLTNGTLSSVDTFVGRASGASGTVVLTGAGTQWTLSDSLYLGGSNTTSGGAGTLTVNGGTSVQIGGTLNMWSSSSLNLNGGAVTATNLNLSGNGTISGTTGGVLTITGPNSSWTGGYFNGAATTVIASGAYVNVAGLVIMEGGHTINNQGTVTFTGDIRTNSSTPSTFNNQGIFNLQSDGSFDYSNSATVDSILNNSGVFRKTIATGTTAFGLWKFNNAGGLLDVETGTVNLGSGGTSAGGAFTTGSGGTLEIGTPYTFDAATTFNNAGNLYLGGGSIDLTSNAITNTGTITVTPYTGLNFNADRTLDGTVNLEYQSSLGGVGNLTFTGALNISGNASIGSKKTIIAAGATLTLSNDTNTTATIGGNLDIAGTFIWIGAQGFSSYSTSAITVNNLASGVIDVRNDAGLGVYAGPTPTLNNYGTLHKSAGTGPTNINWIFNNQNSGLLDVQTGSVNLYRGGASTGGKFQTEGAGTLNFENSYTFDAATTFNNTGTTSFSFGAFNLNGASFINSGTLSISEGSLTLGATIVSNTGAVSLSGGIQTGGTALNLGGQTMNLVGTNNVWSGGTLSGGIWQVGSGATLTMGGTYYKYFSNATLNNQGTVVWSDSSFNIQTAGSGVNAINNQAGGLFNATGNSSLIGGGSGTQTFNNAGTFRKSIGTGTTNVYWILNNQSGGVVDAQTGTMNLNGGGASTGGTFQTEAAGTLAFGSSYTFDSATIFNNAGIANFSGGTFLLASPTITNSGAIRVSSGTVEFDRAITMTNNSVLQVNGGTMRFKVNSGAATVGAGVTATVASGATLELAGSVSALAGPLPIDRVNVTNSSKATGGGLLVSGTNQKVGNIDGTGTTQVNAGASLTANHIVQNALMIGGAAGSPAMVTIDASDSSGNPLDAASDFTLAGLPTSNDPFAAGIVSASISAENGGSLLSSGAGSSGPALGDGASGGTRPAVPEPSTLLLLALGGLTCCLGRPLPWGLSVVFKLRAA